MLLAAASSSATPPPPGFLWVDWLILAIYMAIVVIIGLLATRRRQGSNDYFLASRSMPMWAVAISVLATAQSTATFLGGPQEAYAGNLTYLSTNIGSVLAAVIVATMFLPAYYRRGVTSVYELIGHEVSPTAQRAASGMFMIGRVFASGARLYIVAIPFALVAFNSTQPRHLVLAIAIVATIATLYSITGGIRAVIWTDVLQTVVYISCLIFALYVIWNRIPLSASEIAATLHNAQLDSGGSKLRLIDFSFDPSQKYTFWTALTGFTFLMVAAYGADQDLTQRMLTCRSAVRGSWSVILATLIGLPVVFLFLAMGLLLFIYYQQPEIMGAAAPGYEIDDSKLVFLQFILRELHPGVRGLMMAGLFAAAMSSLDSTLNAMASTTVADFYRPWRARRDREALPGDVAERRVGRWASAFWAVMLSGFACLCIVWNQSSNETLIQFALRVMTFAYSGLLGVFSTVLFTNRGNAKSAIAAMLVGFSTVLLMEPWAVERWASLLKLTSVPNLTFEWRLVIASVLSFVVCAIPPRHTQQPQ